MRVLRAPLHNRATICMILRLVAVSRPKPSDPILGRPLHEVSPGRRLMAGAIGGRLRPALTDALASPARSAARAVADHVCPAVLAGGDPAGWAGGRSPAGARDRWR